MGNRAARPRNDLMEAGGFRNRIPPSSGGRFPGFTPTPALERGPLAPLAETQMPINPPAMMPGVEPVNLPMPLEGGGLRPPPMEGGFRLPLPTDKTGIGQKSFKSPINRRRFPAERGPREEMTTNVIPRRPYYMT